MPVNQLNRDHLTLVHLSDNIQDIIDNLIDTGETTSEKKANVGRMVQLLEGELLDTEKWATKDMTGIQAIVTSGRTFWRS